MRYPLDRMTNLSDREIAQAAAEAGISPAELRSAMAQRAGDLPARVAEQHQGIVAASSRGKVHDFVETRLDGPPTAAIAHLRRFLELKSGHKGHQQGDGEVDIPDDDKGIVYRLSAQSDGAQGSIVRVDIDVSPARVAPTYLAMASPFLGGLAALGLVLTVASISSLWVWLPMLALFASSLVWMKQRSRQSLAIAQDVARAAVVEASTREVRSLEAPRNV